MHPVTYDITVMVQQMEIERAIRNARPFDEFSNAPQRESGETSRIDLLRARLIRLFSVPKAQTVQAD